MKIVPTFLTSCLVAFSLLIPAASLHASSLEGAQLSTDISQKTKPPTIKILLGRGEKEALIEVKGRYFVYNPDNQLLITSSGTGKLDWLTCTNNGINWGGDFPSIFQMRIVPGDSQTTILVNGTQYRGCVEIYAADQTLNIINEVDVESYLKAILSARFSKPLNPEVMDALAIIARTDAYYRIGRAPHAFWHLKASEIGYQGHALTAQNLQVDRAIESTHQMILAYKDAPFAASWTENSAGKTADFSTVFRKKALVPPGVQAPLAAKDRETSAWSFQMTKRQMARILQLSSVKNLELYQDKQSDKVYGMKVSDGKETKHFDFFQLQKALGKQKLRSSEFAVEMKGDKIYFKGFGEGPGVGLCLHSAQIMAEHGDKAPKILSAFFPETKLVSSREWKPQSQEKN